MRQPRIFASIDFMKKNEKEGRKEIIEVVHD